MEYHRARNGRVQLGAFYLWLRKDRDDWNICWFENGRTRRVSTGIGGGREDDPPQAAGQALIDWHRAHASDMTLGPVAPAAMPLDVLIDRWLVEHCTKLADPARYACSITNWQRFFDYLEDGGDTRMRTAAIVEKGLAEDFTAFRRAEHVKAPTIERDMAAMRGALNWGVSAGLLTHAPQLPVVKGHDVAKQIAYSPEELAAIIEAAGSRESWWHVRLFILAMISTHGRVEALYDLDASQIKDGLIYFNAPGRAQTSKHRAIVPVAPSFGHWLEGIEGKLLVYRRPRYPGAAKEEGIVEVPTKHMLLTYRKILLAAHEAHPELGLAVQDMTHDEEPLWLPPRAELGETEWRPRLKAWGSPNSLRHTIHTWCECYGAPRAQIEHAAGHKVGGEWTGSAYSHLRPGYLSGFIGAVEALYDEMDAYTDAHRHPKDPKRGRLTADVRPRSSSIGRMLGGLRGLLG